ncbi:MAG: hypothetical protein GX647_06960 [Clostridiales bacterium]|nr:hypothetical protein [Clostridiales bacterium]
MRILAGLDLGTTGCRCALFDEQLNVLGEDYREYPLMTSENGVAEQDAELWWALLSESLRGAARNCGRPLSDVAALGMSSQGITVVPVDEELSPLANAINWLDHRPGTGGEELVDGRFTDITARLSPEGYGIAKAMWFERHRPDVAARAWKYLMPLDFATAKLTGRAITDHSMAAGMACYDMRERRWSGHILRAAGIPEARLPEIRKSGEAAGFVTEEAARATGLSPETVVAVGAQDQKCGALGAGIRDGIATVSMGTCMAVTTRAERVVCDAERYLPCFSDLFGDGYWLEGCVNVGAGCLKWYRDLYYPEHPYSHVAEMAGRHGPTAESPMFFPHLSGMGTPFRWGNGSGAFYALTLNATADGMAHAVLEAVCLTLRQNLEAAEETAGARVGTLRVFGGGAKSREWLQMAADATGRQVESLFTHEAGCVGAAMLAGLAAGIFPDVEAARRAGVRVDKRFLPDPKRQLIYDRRYELYCQREKRIYREAYLE